MREWLDRVATAYFERILGNLDEIFLFIGVDTTIYYANPAYSRLIGVPREKVIGRKLRDIEPQARIIEVLETEQPVFHDYSYVASAGMDVIGNMFPVWIDGEKVGAVAIFRPISLSIAASDRKRTVDDPEDGFCRELVGKSRVFRNVLGVAHKVAKTDATVLLRGETGVGKEVLARAIHRASPFRAGPFVAVNMASVPETLLESELFGYEAGAFTGASRTGKPGLFEQADGGTLFLDEIGDVGPLLQAKLLRVLQEKQIRRLGGIRSVPVQVRLIAATNRNLEEMVEHGQFRTDLYYRISVIPIYIPALRERDEDILLLADTFKSRLEGKYGAMKTFSPRVLERFLRYSWPGNVRELEACVEYMFLMADGVLLDVQHLPPALVDPGPNRTAEPERASWPGSATTEEPQASSGWASLRRRIEEMEREALAQALRESRTKTEAMRKVGLSRKGFYAKLKKYGLS
ncbi:sigma-54 interaction domain-containing protein [Kyrpidia spormannii]|uniref:Transcriptional regulator containing PAS, AAA-type ATPase, and DNA-binding Fis domains n=1 Tax=Kyrpidia spormannii TaxID=2055160 RepID=A0A6F9ECK5_9BACL|nr:sigma 54-interacting transcriptional regulator [Kyrpidia spormannii]CAB3394028.1 Transcriptional regulator containing PAS, AAA-type ATPase, and DNA-binding Fis domains [Kyrpidia spormannii]